MPQTRAKDFGITEMVPVEAFYYLLVRFVRKEEDMREAWWTTLGTPGARQELSLASLLLSRNDHTRKRYDFLRYPVYVEEDYIYVCNRVKFSLVFHVRRKKIFCFFLSDKCNFIIMRVCVFVCVIFYNNYCS